MKVRLDPDLCAGFGICLGILPEVFTLHEDGYATVSISEVPPEYQDLMQRAADQCPTQAIMLTADGVLPQ